LNWRIYGGTGTDQNSFSYTGSAIPVDQSVTLTTSWQRFTYTTTALTSYNEYALFFFSSPTGTAGAADYYDITGVQLEANPQPTPFEQRPIGVELALCQRYYFRYTGQSAGYSRIMSTGSTYSGSAWGGVVAVPVTMRSNPTAIESSGIGVTDNVGYDSGAFTSVALSSAGSQVGGLYLSCTGAAGVSTNGSGHILILRGGASAYLGISAEL
jgi:hypothetical protein